MRIQRRKERRQNRPGAGDPCPGARRQPAASASGPVMEDLADALDAAAARKPRAARGRRWILTLKGTRTHEERRRRRPGLFGAERRGFCAKTQGGFIEY